MATKSKSNSTTEKMAMAMERFYNVGFQIKGNLLVCKARIRRALSKEPCTEISRKEGRNEEESSQREQAWIWIACTRKPLASKA